MIRISTREDPLASKKELMTKQGLFVLMETVTDSQSNNALRKKSVKGTLREFKKKHSKEKIRFLIKVDGVTTYFYVEATEKARKFYEKMGRSFPN